MADFDMPATGTWEQRGGWVVNRLAVDLGLTLTQAAGPVGNCGFESIGFAHLQEITPVGGGRGGYGWAQWTGARRRAYEAWCQQEKLDPASDAANYGYLVVEMRGAYAYCVHALKAEKTIERCVFVWGHLYEAPGGTTADHLPGYAGRLDYARRALAGAQAPSSGAAAPVRRELYTTSPQMTGGDVDEVIGLLNAWGIDPPLTGHAYDDDVADAVRIFQKEERLGVDGVVGTGETWPALLKDGQPS